MVRNEVSWLNASLLNNQLLHHFVGLAKPWLQQGLFVTASTAQNESTTSLLSNGEQLQEAQSSIHPKLVNATRLWHTIAQSILSDEVGPR